MPLTNFVFRPEFMTVEQLPESNFFSPKKQGVIIKMINFLFRKREAMIYRCCYDVHESGRSYRFEQVYPCELYELDFVLEDFQFKTEKAFNKLFKKNERR